MLVRFAASFLFLMASAAQALDSRFELLLDLDGNPSTGCTVATPAGDFAGVETILLTHVQTTGLDQAEVVLVERQDCVDPGGNVFGPLEIISADGWPVGIGNGVDGFNVIETAMPLAQSYRSTNIRLAVVATDELGNVSVVMQSSPGGGPIVLSGFEPIPVNLAGPLVLGLMALTLLALGLMVMRRKGRMTLTAVTLLSVGGVAGSACLLDGEIFNWNASDQIAATDATDPTNGVDIRAVFAKRSDSTSQLCVRIDAALVFPGTLQAEISIVPADLQFIENQSETVTVTNSAASPVAAENIAADIPGGSNISVQGSTCGASLAIGASCQITFTAPAAEGPTEIDISGTNTNTETVTVTVNPTPIAVLIANPATLVFSENSTGDVTVTNDAGSPVAAENIAADIPGGSNIGVQGSTCGASLAIGASCQITFTAPAPEGPTDIDISGTNTNTETVIVTVNPTPTAVLSVNPSTLLFSENSTGDVTVTNDAGSPVAAENIAATIPGGSNISVQSTTCGASLAIGASCTITFASATQEGPTSVPIAGDNSNTISVDITVTSQPQISITSPVQQSRVVTVSSIVSLALEVTNDAGSAVNANSITVSNKSACPDLSVDDSNCLSVAPGSSCTLELTSSTPYAPCMITVSGSNTANSPQAQIAFSHLGGLVFVESGGSGKVVIDVAQAFNSQWAGLLSDIAGASSLDNGAANTNAIVADAACSGDAANCAAQRCRDISVDWYLPARNELGAMLSALCSNASIPCNFGGFSSAFYSSSSQLGMTNAWGVSFPAGLDIVLEKVIVSPVRCVRSF